MIIVVVSQNLLALGGEDKCITVSNVDGDTIRQVSTWVLIMTRIVSVTEFKGGDNSHKACFGRKTKFLGIGRLGNLFLGNMT